MRKFIFLKGFMPKTSLFMALAAVCNLFSACSQAEVFDGDSPWGAVGGNPLSITAGIATHAATRAGIANFSVGDELGLYITSGTLDGLYNAKAEYGNVKSVWGGSTWAQSTNIYLDNKAATIYAYYPYSASAGNGKAIAVESTSQTDYLYGTGSSTPTIASPACHIEMHHALSQVAFKIKTRNYQGNGILQELKVGNAGTAKAVFTKGTLSAQTGVITGTESGTLRLSANHRLSTTESVFSFLTLPVSPTAGADVLLTFTIDGVNYTYTLSSGTVWQAGAKNVYSITLEGKNITIGGGTGTGQGADGVTIAPWTDSLHGEIQLTPVP